MRQSERPFTDEIFKYNFLNENVWIPIKISLPFVPSGSTDHIPALVQIMALRHPEPTRTTRTPAFWDTPTTSWLHTLVIHIRSQVKTRQSQSYKFYKIAQNSNFEILQNTLHTTHLLKLLDKMCKYEMDPTRTVGATEQTRDAGRTDGRTDRVKPI